MELKKLVPWNWFKKEEDTGTAVPVNHTSPIKNYLETRSLGDLHREVDQLFDDFFSRFGGLRARVPGLSQINKAGFFTDSLTGKLLKPTLDIGSDDKEYSINIEIPGVDQKDVKVEVVNNTLTVSGEKKHEQEKQEKNYYRMERSYGSFQRVLSLPEDANQEKIKADFKNGVLKITMPKRSLPAASNLKQIPIH